MSKVKCETCGGTGEAVISCCTGEVVNSDYAMCPYCKEHLGEDTCPDCEGAGEVEENTLLTNTAPDLQLQAEILTDARKEGVI